MSESGSVQNNWGDTKISLTLSRGDKFVVFKNKKIFVILKVEENLLIFWSDGTGADGDTHVPTPTTKKQKTKNKT